MSYPIGYTKTKSPRMFFNSIGPNDKPLVIKHNDNGINIVNLGSRHLKSMLFRKDAPEVLRANFYASGGIFGTRGFFRTSPSMASGEVIRCWLRRHASMLRFNRTF